MINKKTNYTEFKSQLLENKKKYLLLQHVKQSGYFSCIKYRINGKNVRRYGVFRCSFKINMIYCLNRIGNGVNALTISYNRLWKLLIDKGMNKTKLRSVAGISASTVAKLGKNEPVSMESMLKICKALQCDIGDIVEVAKV